jgi:hypothetical protein
MGEGEVCGVAVEGAMNTLLTVEVIKGVYCAWPRLEDDDSIMVAGSYRPLEDAFRIAHTQLIRWISEASGLSIMDTYQLVTQASRSPIANVCDANYTIVAKMPKRYLPADGWPEPTTDSAGPPRRFEGGHRRRPGPWVAANVPRGSAAATSGLLRCPRRLRDACWLSGRRRSPARFGDRLVPIPEVPLEVVVFLDAVWPRHRRLPPASARLATDERSQPSVTATGEPAADKRDWCCRNRQEKDGGDELHGLPRVGPSDRMIPVCLRAPVWTGCEIPA